MLKEIILSALIATPLGLAMFVGVIYFVVLVIREIRTRHLARIEAIDEDLSEAGWEEVVYR